MLNKQNAHVWIIMDLHSPMVMLNHAQHNSVPIKNLKMEIEIQLFVKEISLELNVTYPVLWIIQLLLMEKLA